MKKLLFVFPIIALLATGCNSSQQTYNQNPVAENTNPTANPIPSNTSTPTAQSNWKTYTSRKYGYSFEYPKDYFLSEQSNEYVLLWQEDPSKNNVHAETSLIVGFGVYKTDKNLGKFITDESNKYDIIEARSVTINGLAAYEGRQTGMLSSYAVIFQSKSNVVVLNFNSGNDGSVDKTKSAMTDIQKLILSTFKFTK